MSLARLAVACGLVLGATACGPGPATDGPAAGPSGAAGPAGASAPVGPARSTRSPAPVATGVLRQFRSGIVSRTLQVSVTASVPLTATGVTLRAGGFATAPAAPTDAALPVGGTVDLPVTYGAADCSGAPGRAVAVLATDGGPVELPLTDEGLLTRLHAAECAERALRAAVDVVVDPDWEETVQAGRPAVSGTLRLVRRRAGERVVLDALGANVVFAVRADRTGSPLLVLGPEQAQASLRVTLVPTRCEAHALAESKRTSLLAGYLGLGDRPPRLTTITPDRTTRDRLEAFAVRGCRTP